LFGSSKSHKVGIECSMLTDGKFERLASIENFSIKFRIFLSFQILFPLIWIFLVSYFIEWCEWVSRFFIVKSSYSLHERCQSFWAFSVTTKFVIVLRCLHCFWTMHRFKGSLMNNGTFLGCTFGLLTLS
jgi:hypothetical protein